MDASGKVMIGDFLQAIDYVGLVGKVDDRFIAAMHLAQNTPPGEAYNPDDWVEQAAEVIRLCLDRRVRPKREELTDTQAAVLEALKVTALPPFERELLEARILAQEGAENIARCHGIPPATVNAYSLLLFDVSERPRAFLWYAQHAKVAREYQLETTQFGIALQRFAVFNGAERLEAMLELLVSLPGETLADGLPDLTTEGGFESAELRIALAECMANPSSRTGSKRAAQIHALFERLKDGDNWGRDEEAELRLQLSKCRIPKYAQSTLRRLMPSGS